jgi:hypothetical protein
MTIIILLNLIPKPRQFWEAKDDRVGTVRHFTKARL